MGCLRDHKCAAVGAGLAFAFSLGALPATSMAEEATALQAEPQAQSAAVGTEEQSASLNQPLVSAEAPSGSEDKATQSENVVVGGEAEAQKVATPTRDAQATMTEGEGAGSSDASQQVEKDSSIDASTGEKNEATASEATPARGDAIDEGATSVSPEGEGAGEGSAADSATDSDAAGTQADPTASVSQDSATSDSTTAPSSGADASSDAKSEAATTSKEDDSARYNNLYRLYNPNSGEHMYTSSLAEMLQLATIGWRYEGVGWVAPVSSGTPVYRLYNPNAGDHHYTTNSFERDMLVRAGWRYEGIGWYSDSASAGTAVFRQYNPNAKAGAHNFTTSKEERDNLVRVGWSGEGIAWYGSQHAVIPLATGHWIVSPSWGSLQRYWLGKDAAIAKSRIVDPTEGSDWYARATSGGAVVRGKYVDPSTGYVYLANNDGKLEEGGLVSTTAYDGGTRHSYLVDADAHAAVPGLHTVDGKTMLTLAKSGWLLQGTSGTYNDRTYLADKAGVLAPDLTATFKTEKGKKEQTVKSFAANGKLYLFLPSYAPLAKVTLGATSQDGSAVTVYLRGSGDFQAVGKKSLDLASLAGASEDATNLSFAFKPDGSDSVFDLVVMRSSGIETIFLNSEDAQNKGRAYVEADRKHNTKANVEVVAIDAEGTVVYGKDDPDKDKFSTVKGRGNSTWGGKKKPYQITLNKKADLLQTSDDDNAQKKWILLANGNDASQLHSTVAYNMALELGMVGVECRPVDLYYDGEYRGSYLLTEKVDIKPGRVDIDSLEDRIEEANEGTDLSSLPTKQATNKYGYTFQYVDGVKDPDDISGGYLLEIDHPWYKTETCWFQTSGLTVVVKSPEVASKNAIKRISEEYEEALRNAKANRFNTKSGYSFDLDSFTKTWLASEFFKNIDAFNTSTFLYLDSDTNTFMAQPLWDFDGSMGVRTDWPDSSFMRYEDISLPAATWVIKIPAVQQHAKQVYKQSFSKLMHNVLLSSNKSAVGDKGYLRSLAYYRDQVRDSQAMDKVVWGISVMGNEARPYSTWSQNVDYLAQWLGDRTAWFDTNVSHLGDFSVTNRVHTYNGVDYGMVYDYDYYLQMNPDVAAAFHGDPQLTLQHFVEHGMAEGRVSSRNFNLAVYKANNPDVVAVFGNRTAEYYRHFATIGYKEGRKAC